MHAGLVLQLGEDAGNGRPDVENWERQEMMFLRSENKRLARDNEALKAALKQRNRDIEEVEARFMRECMNCELRRTRNDRHRAEPT